MTNDRSNNQSTSHEGRVNDVLNLSSQLVNQELKDLPQLKPQPAVKPEPQPLSKRQRKKLQAAPPSLTKMINQFPQQNHILGVQAALQQASPDVLRPFLVHYYRYHHGEMFHDFAKLFAPLLPKYTENDLYFMAQHIFYNHQNMSYFKYVLFNSIQISLKRVSSEQIQRMENLVGHQFDHLTQYVNLCINHGYFQLEWAYPEMKRKRKRFFKKTTASFLHNFERSISNTLIVDSVLQSPKLNELTHYIRLTHHFKKIWINGQRVTNAIALKALQPDHLIILAEINPYEIHMAIHPLTAVVHITPNIQQRYRQGQWKDIYQESGLDTQVYTQLVTQLQPYWLALASDVAKEAQVSCFISHDSGNHDVRVRYQGKLIFSLVDYYEQATQANPQATPQAIGDKFKQQVINRVNKAYHYFCDILWNKIEQQEIPFGDQLTDASPTAQEEPSYEYFEMI